MKEKDNLDRDERYAAWVGFDGGDQEHLWVLQWTDTGERERGRLEQTPEALDLWLGQLMRMDRKFDLLERALVYSGLPVSILH